MPERQDFVEGLDLGYMLGAMMVPRHPVRPRSRSFPPFGPQPTVLRSSLSRRPDSKTPTAAPWCIPRPVVFALLLTAAWVFAFFFPY